MRPLRFATFLAPNLLNVYTFIVRYLAAKLAHPFELVVGSCYEQVNDLDGGFLCGLAYVELADQCAARVEPIAAPLLAGTRYGGRPIYFSDVIVRRESHFHCFANLRGCTWAYNEVLSHSGYGITRYHLVRMGETRGFFGQVVQVGWHERSIRLVCSGEVDASAIDSQVLAVALRDHPELARHLRVIDSLGPSTIQPLVVSSRLSASLKAEMRAVILEMGHDPRARECFARGFVERFVPVNDASYDDLRAMQAACREANFLTLR